MMRPWTRADFVQAVSDEQLRIQVCNTLDNADPSTIEPDVLVDRKFYYSGINAHWFFNLNIQKIKTECKKIVGRLSGDSIQSWEKYRQAVNSAYQDYWVGDRQTKLFTSSYMAYVIGSNRGQQRYFFASFPLMRERLGNGSPGEIFECDFAMHLQHSHDLADAQLAIMGTQAPAVDVVIGTLNDTMLCWPTGTMKQLPKAPTDNLSLQNMPLRADALKTRVPLWFIPDDPSQPFLDFFLLVPSDNNRWTFKAVQNTVSPKHSTDKEQLKRLLGGILEAGFILEDNIQVAFVIESATVQNEVAKSFEEAEVKVHTITGTRATGTHTVQTFKVTVLRPVYAYSRTGATPS
eukprot:scaffold622576_cov63-Attheya_sp.AAC.1